MVEFRASHRYAPMSARKVRLVAALVRGLPVNDALVVLDRSPQRAAVLVGKVVRSAVANAEHVAEIDPNHLRVSESRVDEGPLLGGHLRWRPGARGRAMPYRKRTSHIHIRLSTDAAGARGKAAAPAAPDQPEAGEED